MLWNNPSKVCHNILTGVELLLSRVLDMLKTTMCKGLLKAYKSDDPWVLKVKSFWSV